MRTDWFTNARFGMFIHWGIYAVPGRGEWTYANDVWQPGEYEALAKKFDPVNFDPEEWAVLAKNMKPEKASLHTPPGVLHNPKDCFMHRQVRFIIQPFQTCHGVARKGEDG